MKEGAVPAPAEEFEEEARNVAEVLAELTTEVSPQSHGASLARTESVPAAEAIEKTVKIEENVTKQQGQVKVPFDAGKRTDPPSVYQKSVTTVPTVPKTFVVEEHKSQRSAESLVSTRAPMNSSAMRRASSQVSVQPVVAREPERFMKTALKYRELPTGEFQAQLLLFDEATKVFTITEQSDAIQAYSQYIEESVGSMSSKGVSGYKPQVDEVVLAKFEGQFYRAICESVSSEGIHVHYIDYGNDSVVTEKDIQKLDSKLMNLEVVVHSCYMKNLPEVIAGKIAEYLVSGVVTVENAKLDPMRGMYVARLVGL